SLDIGSRDTAGWFVQNENAAADGKGARNFDELLLGHREPARRHRWRNLGMMKLPKNEVGLRSHFSASHDPVSGGLHAENNVLFHRKIGRKRQLLMDHRNAGS